MLTEEECALVAWVRTLSAEERRVLRRWVTTGDGRLLRAYPRLRRYNFKTVHVLQQVI